MLRRRWRKKKKKRRFLSGSLVRSCKLVHFHSVCSLLCANWFVRGVSVNTSSLYPPEEQKTNPWSCARTCGLAIIISVPRYSACPSFLIVRELELLFWTCRGWNICQTRLLFLNDWWSVAQSSLNSIDRITNGKTIQTWLNLIWIYHL